MINIGEVCGSPAIQQAKIKNSFRTESSFEAVLGNMRSAAADTRKTDAAESEHFKDRSGIHEKSIF